MIWWLAVNSNPEGFTVHMNSVHEIILGENVFG